MLEKVAEALCQALRQFATVTCPRYVTTELPREASARVKRQQAQVKRGTGTRERKKTTKSPKLKRFNMSTYKMHCIPNYPDAIRRYGMTDSYSTQTVSPLCTIGSTAALTNTERAGTPPLEDVV